MDFHAVWLNKDLFEKILKIVPWNPGLPTELWRGPARLVGCPGTEAWVYWVISLLILLLRRFGSMLLVELNSIILDSFFPALLEWMIVTGLYDHVLWQMDKSFLCQFCPTQVCLGENFETLQLQHYGWAWMFAGSIQLSLVQFQTDVIPQTLILNLFILPCFQRVLWSQRQLWKWTFLKSLKPS